MARATATGFEAVRIEGGLLPAEFLARAAALQAPYQAEADYRIPPGLRLRDEIGRYWQIARALWHRYAAERQRPHRDPAAVGVHEWLEPLLREVLGFKDIRPVDVVEAEGRRFPLTHQALDGRVPLVLTTADRSLDRGHPDFGDEGRRRSPHALVQEYLNAEKRALWGIVANGVQLRLLRDNPSLTRPAYLEVDLERLFEEELYADFALFWLLCHASRLAPRDGDPAACVLEAWRGEAQETGERARERLREGVEQALRELGCGFLEHPANTDLRARIQAGELTAEGLHHQLLRLIYRLLFLFTTEDRDLLHDPAATPEARALYREGYSLVRLRELALVRSAHDRHNDLWEGLRVTFRALREGAEPLGLPPLGGLFADDQCPDLEFARLGNRRLLAAVRALAWLRADHGLTRVNYRDMDTEELGSVYESLLELVPVIHVESEPWRFGFLGDEPGDGGAPANGRAHARKRTGSYYTPDSLVQELIRSALEPVIERALREHPDRPREALLALKIVDPAAGSGHFLLAAARRLAAEVARIEAGGDQPDLHAYRHALREVVAHCIYGVDLNPLAVELCKTALWLETVEPGKPLGFLDAHIRCGNALVGVLDPAVLREGIPDEAYKPLTGDDRRAATQLRGVNREVRKEGVLALHLPPAVAEPQLPVADLNQMPEDTPEQVAAKRAAWQQARASYAARRQRLVGDLWTAAFFAPKRPDTYEQVPTTQDLLDAGEGRPVRQPVSEAARTLAAEHRFFHWHLEFPEVFARGGFDCVLGNPPWERIKLQEQEFFASRDPKIANAPNAASRRQLIEALVDPDPELPEGIREAKRRLYRDYEQAKRASEAASQFVRTSGRFPLTGVGDVNLYAVFAELFLQLAGERGRAGLIVPTGIATDDSTKRFFDHLLDRRRLVSLYDFENREGLFPAVDSRQKFCLLTLGAGADEPEFLFFATRVGHLRDPRRRFTLTAEDVRLLNPNTRTCPVFRSRRDAELTRKIYRNVPVLVDETRGDAGNPWGIRFAALFHMSNDSGLFRTADQLQEDGAARDGPNWRLPDGTVYVPLYEAKMVHQFDHRWAEYGPDGKPRDLTDAEKADPIRLPEPRYWVPRDEVESRLAQRGWTRRWLLGWRDITNATNERTVIATVIPRTGVGNKYPLIIPDQSIEPIFIACLLGNLCVLCMDYVARQKIGGTTLNFFLTKTYINKATRIHSMA